MEPLLMFFVALLLFLWILAGQGLAVDGIPWRAISSEDSRVAPTDVGFSGWCSIQQA
jgi:hypothetical protein